MTIQDCNDIGARDAETVEHSADSVCRFIETLVSAALGASLTELRGANRGRAPAAFARQTAMYLAHVHFGLSLSQVGRNFGRDRTTVSHACARVEDSRDDPKFERVLACLEAALDRWHQGFLAFRSPLMAKQSEANIAALLTRLTNDSNARLVADDEDNYRVEPRMRDGSSPIAQATVSSLRARGLLVEAEPGKFVAAPVARAWLKRRASAEQPFRHQHGEVVTTRAAGDRDREVLVDLDESPVASLARRPGKNGEPWLSSDLAAAAERLRRDFELGQLQPRITANWSASVSDGRRSGDGSGLKDLTDMALAARLRFDRAMREVGPEFSGVLVDVCCFLKGLETVERERQWPGRSAKLVLRMALTSLARHYGLMPVATGKASVELRHWGADDYRPAIG